MTNKAEKSCYNGCPYRKRPDEGPGVYFDGEFFPGEYDLMKPITPSPPRKHVVIIKVKEPLLHFQIMPPKTND